MKHINRRINLSQYKSFLYGMSPSIKEGEFVDIKNVKNQMKYNVSSNYSMMPLTCQVVRNDKPANSLSLFWAWDTLHKIYLFFKNTPKEDICWEDGGAVDEFVLRVIPFTVAELHNKYDDIKYDIINYVEQGQNNGVVITFSTKEEAIIDTCDDDEDDTDTFISIPIHITNTIDNLGQVTNLMDEWEPKTNYKQGTITAFDNDVWRLSNRMIGFRGDEIYENGYTWNDKYKESVFGNLAFDEVDNEYKETIRQWDKSLIYSMNPTEVSKFGYPLDSYKLYSAFYNYTNGGKLSSFEYETRENPLTYTYIDNKLYLNPTKSNTALQYPIIVPNKNFIIDDGIVYTEEEYNYVVNFGCELNKLLVQFDCGVPYIEFKGERYYGYAKGANSDSYIFEYKLKGGFESTLEKGIMYKNKLYKISNGEVSIGSYYRTYQVCSNTDGYFNIDGKFYIIPLFSNGGKKIFTYEFDDEAWASNSLLTSEKFVLKENDVYTSINSEIDAVNQIFKIYRDFTEYYLNYVQGVTASQLSIFKQPTIFDNLGKEFDAAFNIEQPKDIDNVSPKAKYTGILRPQTSDFLSLRYQAKTTNNLTQISDNIFWGNILDTIEFFIVGSDGSTYEFSGSYGICDSYDVSTGEKLKDLYNLFTLKYDAEDSYKLKLCIKEEGDDALDQALSVTGSILKCRIKYNIGAMIEQTADGFRLAANGHKGVEYTDIYILTKKDDIYGRGRYNKYPVSIFQMEGEPLDSMYNVAYGDVKATFRTEIPIFGRMGDGLNLFNDSHFGTDSLVKFDPYRNFIYAPTYREEYNIGTACQEKISADIYIDRGISSAFEKHLKLQEIETLQDLENYSNGGFFSINSIQ